MLQADTRPATEGWTGSAPGLFLRSFERAVTVLCLTFSLLWFFGIVAA